MTKFLWVAGALFLVGTIFSTIEVSSLGGQLVSLENKGGEYSQENEDLSSALVASTSLSKLSEDASSSGFTRPQSILYLTPEQPVAKLP